MLKDIRDKNKRNRTEHEARTIIIGTKISKNEQKEVERILELSEFDNMSDLIRIALAYYNEHELQKKGDA